MPALEFHAIAAIFPLIEGDAFTELCDSIQRNGQREDILLLDGKILDGRNRYRACEVVGVQPRTRAYDPKRDGTNVLELVLDQNLRRRHLSASQRALIAAQALQAMQQMAAAKTEPELELETKDQGPGTGTTVEDDGTLMEGIGATGPASVAAPTLTDVLDEEDDEDDDDDEEGDGTNIPSQKDMADQAGVSERTLHQAAKVLKEAPDLIEKVKAGTLTLSAAEEELKKRAAKAEREKIEKRLLQVCGANFRDAFREGTVLKTTKELAAFIALDDETMAKVAPLVATGWATKRAAAHVTKKISGETTVDDLINHAISSNGEFIINHAGFEIAVTKIS